MKTRTFSAFLYTLLLGSLLISCAKDNVISDNNVDPCISLAQLHIHPFTAVTKEEEIRLSVDSLVNVDYHWTGPNNFESYDQNPIVSDEARFSQRGWYYVSMSLDECTPALDSVYVNVQFPQGAPDCSLTNNQGTFSGIFLLGDQSYYYVGFGPDQTGYGVEAHSTNGDLRISMSVYWTTHDLEDGIYYTAHHPEAWEIDKISMFNVNQNILWTAEPGKPVYISHVGGKPRVSFCNISFAGDWGGTLYHTSVNAQITQP